MKQDLLTLPMYLGLLFSNTTGITYEAGSAHLSKVLKAYSLVTRQVSHVKQNLLTLPKYSMPSL